jgi:hypothetical protein
MKKKKKNIENILLGIDPLAKCTEPCRLEEMHAFIY